MNHSSKKSRQLAELMELSYLMATRPVEDDTIIFAKDYSE
jgi:hypothetical protein